MLPMAGLLAVLVNLPHLLSRACRNNDFDIHYRWALEVSSAMAAGDPWPRWMQAANHGLGEPAFLFYAPAYFLLTGLIHFATGSTWIAMQIVQTACIAIYVWTTWLIVRPWTGPRWALAAAILAALNPMLGLVLYGFNGFPWAAAFAPLTVLLWALLRHDPETRIPDTASILAFTATILFHTVSGLMAAIAIAALSLQALSWRDGTLHIAWRMAASRLLTLTAGILLAAAYLVPAIASRHLIHAEVLQAMQPFNAFALPTVTAWVFGVRWFGFQWPPAILSIAVIVLSFLCLRGRLARLDAAFRVPVLIVAGVSIFLATELSFPLWIPMTPLRDIQFPHRFVTLISILVPVLGIPVLARMAGHGLAWRALAGALIAQGVLGGVVLAKDGVHDAVPLALVHDRLVPYIGLDEYRLWGAGPHWQDYVAQGGFIGACGRLHVTCSALPRHGRSLVWRVQATRPVRLVLPVFALPAFETRIDGLPVAAERDSATGLLAVDLQAGAARIEVAWVMLPSEKLGLGISAGTALALALGAVLRRRRGVWVISAAARS